MCACVWRSAFGRAGGQGALAFVISINFRSLPPQPPTKISPRSLSIAFNTTQRRGCACAVMWPCSRPTG
jgi:hypothetical protein